MTQLIRFFIFLFILPVAFSFAQVSKHYEKFYYSSAISPFKCGQNINRFIQYLSRQGHYDPRMKVIYFEAPNNAWGFSRVVALNSRWGKEINNHYHQNWDFHVVAELDGKIYDFSFDKKPRILGILDYFNEMLIPRSPIAIYGQSFRVKGEGPYYNADLALKELEDHQFSIIHTSPDGSEKIIEEDLNYSELLNLIKS